jgi:hypothetical protein
MSGVWRRPKDAYWRCLAFEPDVPTGRAGADVTVGVGGRLSEIWSSEGVARGATARAAKTG